MKPIILNINEMSDSREVYDSKPNFFITLFIYLILGILLISIIWMYFGHIDVVVKSEGMIRPNNQVATVVNTYGGTIVEVNAVDGSNVSEGDILYIIEHEDLLTELDYYNNQLKEAEETLSGLHKYKESIEDGVNHLRNIPEEEEYYLKFRDYYINYNVLEKNSTYDEQERNLNFQSISEQLDIAGVKLNNIQRLKSSVNQHKNMFSNSGSSREYYNLFQKYLSDYDAIVNQYKNAKTEIDNSTTEEGLINTLDYYTNQLDGLKILYSSIVEEESLFGEVNSYSLQYEEYVNKLEELKTAHQQAKDNYDINKELEGIAVSEWEVGQSKIAMEDANRAVETYRTSLLGSITSNITEVTKKLDEIKLSKDNTMSKVELYKKNNKDLSASLENFRLKYIVELDTTIDSLTNNINNLELNKSSLELKDEKTYFVEENNQHGSLAAFKISELRTTIDNINTYKNRIGDIETNIVKINTKINSAIVKATKAGVVNTNIEMVEGDTLASGVDVLTIIPENDSEYKVNIYVSNDNIGKLKEGMEVKFNVYALPNSEYGYLKGAVTKISKDLKVDSNNSSGYYLVEASLENKTLYDAKGETARLKMGMACQARMITESKRILTYVLEKVDLWFG